jgi:hypothetical protein
MSHENSMQIDQQELTSEYGRYIETKSKNGIMSFFVKALVIPVFALLVIFTGAAFAVANFSPVMYTQAKDIVFENVDFEKITGQTDAINKEVLDSWLILNSEKQQDEAIAQEEMVTGEQIESPLK